MQLCVYLTHKNVAHAFDRLESCLDNVKKWLSAYKLKLNPDKTKFIILVQKYVKNSINQFQLIFLVISSLIGFRLWNTHKLYARRRHLDGSGDDYNPNLYGLGLKRTVEYVL